MSQPDLESIFQKALADHQAGRLPGAEFGYRQVLALDPDHGEALHLLGVVFHQTARNAEAYESITRASSTLKHDPRLFNNLGEVCRATGRSDEAIAAFNRALALNPNYPQAHHNLGLTLQGVGRSDDAVASIRRAIELKPDYAKAYSSLAIALTALGRLDEAIGAAKTSIRLNPVSPEAFNNLGSALRAANRLDEAIDAYRQAIRLKPDHASSHQNLGEALARQGDIDAAIESVRSALRIRPDYLLANQTLLFMLHYSENVTPDEVFEEHRRFAERYEGPLKRSIRPHDNDRSPGRRLHIGYVSPDFRRHPVGYFMRPIFANHDPDQVELFAYAGGTRPDAATEFFRSRAQHFRDITALSDEQFAEQVRADRIDILVDLTLHMAHNRLLAFARKPAPVQVTYLGYPHSTGLTTMDYKLSDWHIDPEGLAERFHTERIARLPDTFFCCEGESDAPDVGQLPARRSGVVTFASFNTLMKITDSVVTAWSRLLADVPRSRLLMVAGGLDGANTQATLRERFVRHGVDESRLELLDQSGIEHGLSLISRADIALDTFPYGGGTTTCNCLWMGVPVVTLAGASPVGRQGVSFLTNVGLPELIAQSRDEYLSIAAALARDPDRLADIRASLRERMRESPIMDGPRFVRNLENVYRSMWQAWCEGGATA